MADDVLDLIVRMRSATALSDLKQYVRDAMRQFGYDRVVLFSVAPAREAFVERIFWLEGHWFEEELDDKTYLQRCPVNRHFIHTSRPFLWCKTRGENDEETYQIVEKPISGALNGIQLPVFGRAGIEGALSLGGTAVVHTPRAELFLILLASEAFYHFRRLLNVVQQEASVTLTVREKDVLRLVGQGLKHSEIASTLSISGRTVENHLRRIRSRLGVATTAQAVQVAMMTGEFALTAP